MPANYRERSRTSKYAELSDFTMASADRRARAEDKERGRTEIWCPGAESNHRHCDFQSHALPTELPGRRSPPERRCWSRRAVIRARFRPVQTRRECRFVRHFRPLSLRRGITPRGARKLRRVGELLGFLARDRIGAGEPATKVDVLAARRAERSEARDRGLAADRAGSCRVGRFAHALEIGRSAAPSKGFVGAIPALARSAGMTGQGARHFNETPPSMTSSMPVT